MTKQFTSIIILALVFAGSGCSDAQIGTPTDSSNLKYSFHTLGGSSEFGGVEVFLLRDSFTVNENNVSTHRYTDEYNGCVRINAVISDKEAVSFTFINWSRIENQLILDLNLSPEPDWTMVITNDDGGKLEAVMSGRTSDGKQRVHLLEGPSPMPNDGEVCTDKATVVWTYD